jgi:thymidylate synthase ThyX
MYPLETLFCVWEQSRHNGMIPDPWEVSVAVSDVENGVKPFIHEDRYLVNQTPNYYIDAQGKRLSRTEFKAYYRDTVIKLFSEAVPVLDHLEFVFQIEGIPIALREQMVRHRVGAKVGQRLGADIVPDLAQSAWWSQSHRVLDLSTFADDGMFITPESMDDTITDQTRTYRTGKNNEYETHVALDRGEVYLRTMKVIQEAYATLVRSGVPKEEARNLIPLGTTHRTTWAINAMALKHVIGKRSCWILQRGLWEELILGMVSELAQIDPLFRAMVNPPCIKGDTFVGCPVSLSNIERIKGKDELPPCPLFLHHHREEALEAAKEASGSCWVNIDQLDTGLVEHPEEEYFGWRTAQDESVPTLPYPGGWLTTARTQAEHMDREREGFTKLWSRDVDDGHPIDPATV